MPGLGLGLGVDFLDAGTRVADLGRILFDAYDARCEAASGNTEASVCTINALNDLL